MVMGIVLTIIFAIVGGFFYGAAGVLFGMVLGYLAASVYQMKIRIEHLERRIRDRDALRPRKRVEAGPRTGPSARDQRPPVDHAADISDTDSHPAGHAAPSKPTVQLPAAQPNAGPGLAQKFGTLIRDFFTRGNVVVKIGLIILFFGVGFLIKYAADRNMMPIEFRLCFVAGGGILMLALGWRLRRHRRGYAVLIQGGGIGVLYLTVFAAVKVYNLLPAAAGFFLLVGLVFLCVVLALLLDARALALFGTVGGFLAPVLMAAGTGDHVFLFSFYALLNAGILGISWFRAWRELNIAGFSFTFVIGTAWGVMRYRPEYFASTEPFLVLFFLMYVAISVLHAHRQPIDLKGYIDGPLVFGLPLVTFGLQATLVSPYEYGIAWSAAILGAFYLMLGRVLFRRRIDGMQALAEVFLSTGVVFASLAIPLAMDSSWTTVLWGLEGAGLVWIGLRQKRLTARCFGLLLQLGAGVSFLYTANFLPVTHTPVLNGVYMSCLVIGAAGLLSNYCYMHFRQRLYAWESHIHQLLVMWALAWWFAGGLNEIGVHVTEGHRLHAVVAFVSASAWSMGWLYTRLDWKDLEMPPAGLAPVLFFIAAGALITRLWMRPFSGIGLPAWTAALACQYHLLKRFQDRWDSKVTCKLHPLTLYLVIFLAAWSCARHLDEMVGGPGWAMAAWGAVPSGVALLLVMFGRRISWPLRRFAPQYVSTGLLPVMGAIWLFSLLTCFRAADPAPLAYVPIFNPVEIVQIFALMVIVYWRKVESEDLAPFFAQLPPHAAAYAVGAAGFLWLNGVIARTVHFWGGVAYNGAALFDSVVFQAAVSITWTITALGIMIGANRLTSRAAWCSGAAILGLVVVKLFLVDLAGIGTVARIISFLAVGLLMLVIGYFSPLPPKPAKMSVY